MISVDEALAKIVESVNLLPVVDMPLLSALGGILAEDVFADTPLPPFDNSAMDGYAVRARDVGGASLQSPVTLEVLEELPAGYVAVHHIQEGQAVKIMTGAPLPGGADSVVKVEETEKDGGKVKVYQSIKVGANVRCSGEEVSVGERVLQAGTPLGPAHIGMLAALGRPTVRVIKRPKVAILSTGDELVEVGDQLKPGKIRNSNAYSLAGQVFEAGAEPVLLGIASDNKKDLLEKLEEALHADMVITSGGVSVGDYDLVKQVLAEMGEMVFWKVAMRPGKPLAFGLVKGTPLFGLPGNPTSSMVSFELFVRPSILKMAGRRNLMRPEVEVVVDERISAKPGLRYFLRVKLDCRDGEVHASLSGPQGSGMLKAMTLADGLLVIPEETTAVEPGERAKALPLWGNTPFFVG